MLQLAGVAIVTSDIIAANVLLRQFGGPSELTAFWRPWATRTAGLIDTNPT